MDIKASPVTMGMTGEDIADLIGQGFQFLGIVPLVDKKGVATPNNPAVGLAQPMIVWVRQEPMMTIRQVSSLLMAVHTGKTTAKQILDSMRAGAQDD